MVFKGVHVGAGSFVEPGSVLTTDVPPRSRVLGNPAQIIGQV
jgi:acetyltransferase-like isoleucine patch superfamily enzyme